MNPCPFQIISFLRHQKVVMYGYQFKTLQEWSVLFFLQIGHFRIKCLEPIQKVQPPMAQWIKAEEKKKHLANHRVELNRIEISRKGKKMKVKKRYTVWNQPKVGFLISGFLASQFLQELYFRFDFKNLFKTDIASVIWRDVHSFGFTALESNSWLPSENSGYADASLEYESNLLAPTISPFPISFNWKTHLATLS